VNVDTPVSAVATCLCGHQDMGPSPLAYAIVKTIMEHLPELVAIHKEATHITLKDGASGKFVPYHKGRRDTQGKKVITVFV